MKNQEEIKAAIYQYIADSIDCSIEQLESDDTCFVKNRKEEKDYIKILSIKYANELYESTLIFGQTLHYIPNMKKMIPLPLTDGFSYKLYEENELSQLCGIKGFENSLAFDENGNTPTAIVLCARKDEKIIAIAGASKVSGNIMEVGIDVNKEWRGYGLARLLVRNLTIEILKRDQIPFYSASVTNLASQAVAFSSGYMLLWTDSFGVR